MKLLERLFGVWSSRAAPQPMDREAGKGAPSDLSADLVRQAFDPDYYRSAYPKALEEVEDALAHFNSVGVRKRFNPNDWFETRFYMFANVDVRTSGVNPLGHYLTVGRDEGRAPSEAAFIAPEFDAAYYLRRYPDFAEVEPDPVRHYLNIGASQGRAPTSWFSAEDYLAAVPSSLPSPDRSPVTPFAHYLLFGRAEGVPPKRASAANPDFALICETRGVDASVAEAELAERELDVGERLAGGVLGEMVAKIAALEPLVHHPPRSAVKPNIGLCRTPAISLSAAFARVEAEAFGRRARAAVVLPNGRWRRAGRVGAAVAHALTAQFGADDVVVIFTDDSALERRQSFPEGVRLIDLAGAAVDIDALNDRCLLLFQTLRALAVDTVVNVESDLFWRMNLRLGSALKAERGVFSYVFAPTMGEDGIERGFGVYRLVDAFEHHHGIITDDPTFAETLVQRFALPAAYAKRVRVVDTPVPVVPPVVRAKPEIVDGNASRLPRVVWTGRPYDNAALAEIAKRLTDVELWAWLPVAEGEEGREIVALRHIVAAEADEGEMLNDPHQAGQEAFAGPDIWLLTEIGPDADAMADELAATGLPVIAASAGSTRSEAIFTYPSRVDETDPEACAAAIRTVLADLDDARKRALDFAAQRRKSHGPERYAREIAAFLEEARP